MFTTSNQQISVTEIWNNLKYICKCLFAITGAAVFLSQISPMLDFNKNPAYFFIFVTWYSLIFWTVLVVFTNTFGSKSWNHGGIHEVRQKKSWNQLGICLGPRASAPALGPKQIPNWFQLIFLPNFMKPPWFQDLLPKSIRETTKTAKKISETRTQKKMPGFPLKPRY